MIVIISIAKIPLNLEKVIKEKDNRKNIKLNTMIKPNELFDFLLSLPFK